VATLPGKGPQHPSKSSPTIKTLSISWDRSKAQPTTSTLVYIPVALRPESVVSTRTSLVPNPTFCSRRVDHRTGMQDDNDKCRLAKTGILPEPNCDHLCHPLWLKTISGEQARTRRQKLALAQHGLRPRQQSSRRWHEDAQGLIT